jgi:hypothetical protein
VGRRRRLVDPVRKIPPGPVTVVPGDVARVALELCDDRGQLEICPDGSVIIHNRVRRG